MRNRTTKLMAMLVIASSASMAWAGNLSYLEGLLAATPAGGWVKVSANRFSDAWPTGADLPPAVPGGPENVVTAWSGFAWDSNLGELIMFGGGHAAYVGNEVYVWQGANGLWTRGTAPSAVDLSTGFVVGDGAPQASHTYGTSIYVPINDRFVLFGGAGWPYGHALEDANGRTGVWWWDPSKANPLLVGGGDYTGWNATRAGGNSWQARAYDPWVGLPGTQGLNYIDGTSAYRTEAGKDVVYVTMDINGSGLPSLVRYELGSPSTPDSWKIVGYTAHSVAKTGAAAVDTSRGLFVRTALAIAGYTSDLSVFDLSKNNASNPSQNLDFGVRLVTRAGVEIDLNLASSIAYDVANDEFVIWDGLDRGTVWVTRPEYLEGGAMDPVWTVEELASSTTAQPVGHQLNGVVGKWKYVEELGAFIALDAYDFQSRDSEVWMYKPLEAVPEVPSKMLLVCGLLVVGYIARVRRPRDV